MMTSVIGRERLCHSSRVQAEVMVSTGHSESRLFFGRDRQESVRLLPSLTTSVADDSIEPRCLATKRDRLRPRRV